MTSATFDSDLLVQVVRRQPLYYERGADPELDRPAHVRAGSALVRLGDELVVIQDDALFLAILDSRSLRAGAVKDVPLPALDGVRTFDEGRGNKSKKLDLEACFVDGTTLFALGSGGTRQREQVLSYSAGQVRFMHAAALYETLWKSPGFSGAELNIEGAVARGDDVLLFQRGNGKSPAVDAIAWFPRGPLVAYLRGETSVCPAPTKARVYDLGTVDGVRLTFTDGALDARGRVAFLAAAEASPDSYRDGPTVAVALGWLSDDGEARLSRIVDENGAPFTAKAEGLVFDTVDEGRALLVVDLDDPEAPCELCELVIKKRTTS